MTDAEHNPSNPATVVACTAVSAILLISLVVAVVEAVAAIRRKLSSGGIAPPPEAKDQALCRIGGCADGRVRRKKISLPEFTWIRHIRRCAKMHPHGEPNNNKIRTVQECAIAEELAASKPEYNSAEDADASATPVSHIRQLGAVRFAAANRRISTPVAPRKISSANPQIRKLSDCSCSHPGSSLRPAMAVCSSSASLPLTPGVARLCSSLTDILESNYGEGSDTLEKDCSLVPRHLLEHGRLEPNNSTTALEARLKRVRLIRHR